MDKVFAPNYTKNEQGWYIFPACANYRKSLFPEEAGEHIARANVYLVEEIIKYVSEPGDTLLDIMAGSGTIMVGALTGRRVICIEIEKDYQDTIVKGIDKLDSIKPGVRNLITLIPGDANVILPIPGINHIIFSPPYAQIMKMSKPTGIQAEMYSKGATYQRTEGNVGKLNTFLYNQKMERIYKKCFDSLVPGGTMTVIIKDYIQDQKRVYISDWVMQSCSNIGFQLKDWFKWDAPGTFFHNFREARGENIVTEEEIIILEKK
jgi:16S rRNA G966 N2-methylase RsmD